MTMRRVIWRLASRSQQAHRQFLPSRLSSSLDTPALRFPSPSGIFAQEQDCSPVWIGPTDEAEDGHWEKFSAERRSSFQLLNGRSENSGNPTTIRPILGCGAPLPSKFSESIASALSGGRRMWSGFRRKGSFALGFVELSNVRFASTVAAAEDGLRFVEGETGDIIQAGIPEVHDVTLNGVADVGSSLSEVAAATADCSVPTAALQHIIDYIHMQTGLPWWLSIAATTVAIRIAVLPVLVFQMKATARLTLMRPELERITNAIKESGYDPKVTESYQKRMKELFTKHKTNPFMPLMGAFVQAPLFISFFFAPATGLLLVLWSVIGLHSKSIVGKIRNMAEKVPSFKEGGALWFTDLTTPDTMYILPVLSGLFTLATIELGAMDGMQGQPMIGKMKMFFRGFAILIIPLTASFPKALFCYWLTTNMCSLLQTTVLRQPAVKRAVGIPETAHLAAPVTQAPTAAASVVTLNNPPKRQKKTKG